MIPLKTIIELGELYGRPGHDEANDLITQYNWGMKSGKRFMIYYYIHRNGGTSIHTAYFDSDGKPITQCHFSDWPEAITPHLIEQIYHWSLIAFGPGRRTEGIADHIRKELTEVAAKPDDLEEWIDLMLLSLNGAQRLDAPGQSIIKMFLEKVTKNMNRDWPDWRTSDPDKAIEHVK